jgi:hypothetical protein
LLYGGFSILPCESANEMRAVAPRNDERGEGKPLFPIPGAIYDRGV